MIEPQDLIDLRLERLNDLRAELLAPYQITGIAPFFVVRAADFLLSAAKEVPGIYDRDQDGIHDSLRVIQREISEAEDTVLDARLQDLDMIPICVYQITEKVTDLYADIDKLLQNKF